MNKTPPADFLSAAKAFMPEKTITIAGMTVVVRGLSVRQLEECNKQATIKSVSKNKSPEIDGQKLTGLLIGLSIYDVDGVRLIPPDREDEVFDLPNDMIKQLSDIVFEINGIRVAGSDEGNG